MTYKKKLEKVKIEYPFLKKGVQLAIDDVEPAWIEAVLNILRLSATKRHETGSGSEKLVSLLNQESQSLLRKIISCP